MKSYAESPICRRKFLLNYFGETYEQDNCHNCDNCKAHHKRVEAKETLISILEAVSVLKEEFKTDYIIHFLLGKKTVDIENYKHDDLEEFGSLKGEDEELLDAVIRQAIIDGYIDKSIERHGILSLTAKGRTFMKKPSPSSSVSPQMRRMRMRRQSAPPKAPVQGAVVLRTRSSTPFLRMR